MTDRHVQSAAHPWQRAAAGQLIASERIDIVHAHSAGAAWSAIAATRPHAGVPGHVVSRPTGGGFLAGHAVPRFAGARRPRDRAVELHFARDDRALQNSGRPHHRDPARSRHRQFQSSGGERRPHRGAAPGVGNSAADARGAGSRPHRAVERADEHDRRGAAPGGRRRPQHRLRVRRRGPRADRAIRARCAGRRACTASTRSAVLSAIAPICRPPTRSPMWWWCRRSSRR